MKTNYLSLWMIREIASKRTLFLALECWTFLDLGGSWALFRMVSRHSLRRPRTPGSSENNWIFELNLVNLWYVIFIVYNNFLSIFYLEVDSFVRASKASQTTKVLVRNNTCNLGSRCSLKWQSERIKINNNQKINILFLSLK